MYSPLVRKGGIIVFHDIVNNDPNGLDIEVFRFWGYIKNKYLNKELVVSKKTIIGKLRYGIGIIFIA